VEEMMRRPAHLFAAMILGILLVGALPAEARQLAKVEVLTTRARPAMGRAFPRRKRASVVWAVTLLALLAALPSPIPASQAPEAEHHYWAGSTRDQSVGAAAPVSQPGAAPQMSEQEALGAYEKLPLSFVPNEGQMTEEAVRYYAQGTDYGFFFTKRGAMLSFANGKGRGHALALEFLGADPDATLTARDQLAGKVNYLIGDDTAKWRQDLSTYAELLYGGLWPGIATWPCGGKRAISSTSSTSSPVPRLMTFSWATAGPRGSTLVSVGNCWCGRLWGFCRTLRR